MPDRPAAAYRSLIRWSGLLGCLTLVGFLDRRLELFHLFALFFLVPFVAALFQAGRIPPGAPALPVFAAYGLAQVGRYLLSTALGFFLNPFSVWQGTRQVTGQLVALIRVRGKLPSAASYRSTVEYAPPFEGEWLVFAGGVTLETSHSWNILSQRYAYDFLRVDAAGRSRANNGCQIGDCLAYGRNILAPAAGRVVATRNDMRDSPHVGSGWLDWRARDIRGNYVVIQHAPNEFSLLAHLVPGSVAVHGGEAVGAGQIVGRCGNSGNSTEPHLHFQLQDTADFWSCVGLPVRFTSAVEAPRTDGNAAAFLKRGDRLIGWLPLT